VSRANVKAAFALCILVVLCKMPVRAASQEKQKKSDAEDSAVFLVARPELRDPLFKESVIFMLPSSLVEGGDPVIGLIINRSARIALREIFPEDKALAGRSETAYFGGPVDPRSPGIVFRSPKDVKEAALLFGDVYVSFDPDFVEKLLKKPGDATDLRLFLGRSQWSPDQLQNEMLKGAWDRLEGETSLLFSAKPEYLWRELLGRTEPAPIA
jgi:putative transcriptional regulator